MQFDLNDDVYEISCITLPFFCCETAGSTGPTESLTAGTMAGGSSNRPPGSLEKFSPIIHKIIDCYTAR